MTLQEEQFMESKSHISDLQYELEKSRYKETKLERTLADAIAKLERDRAKLNSHEMKQDSDSDQSNSTNNTVTIAENKVN